MTSVIIDSNFRTSGSSTDFLYEFKPQVKGIYPNVSMSQLILTNTFYSVRQGFNASIRVQTATELKTVTITEGTYTGAQLAGTMQTAFNNVFSSTWTITFNRPQDQFVFTYPESFSLLFADSLSDPSAYRLLGFDNVNTASSTSISSSQSPVLRDNYFFLRFLFNDQGLSNNRLEAGGTRFDVLVPNTAQIGENILFFNNIVPLGIIERRDSTAIYNVKVQLLDNQGNILNNRNGSLVVKLDFT